MTVPTQEEIHPSLSRLHDDSLFLFRQDIINIAWAFTFHPNQHQLLQEINIHNKKLAETLLVFRRSLQQAAASPQVLESTIDQLHLHYVINTDGPIPIEPDEDPFDVFDASRRYGASLCVGVSKGADNASVLSVNEDEKICAAWDIVPGWSAAWSLRQVGPVINRVRYGRNDVIPSVAFGFNENAKGHTLQNAMTLADFSHLAYFAPLYVEKQVKQWGFTEFAWVNDPVTDTQAFLSGNDKYAIVCFRGTSSKTDAWIDLKFLKTDAFGGRGRVHGGFQQALDSVWSRVQDAIDKPEFAGKKLLVCGHSLGAALSQLAAHRLALGNYPVEGVYVYGSPRVGNREFKEAYDTLLKDKTFLHINDSDIVTKTPPEIFGFFHLGGAPRIFNEGHEISMNDAELTEVPEKQFDDLDIKTREEIQLQIDEAQKAIAACTRFLTTSPEDFVGNDYQAVFEKGAVDNHGNDQYLFKLGCAIVDSEWQQQGP